MNELLKYLSEITIPKTRRKAISSTSCRTVTLGVINKPFSTFKGYSKFTDKHPKLWELLLELGKQLDPDHQFSSVTINHNVECMPHKDARNSGTTLIIALGDYTGGELVVDDEEIDIKEKPYYFNGYLKEHYNKPFTGDRYSLMFYSCKKTWDIEHREEDIPIIREVYHGNQYHNAKIGFGVEKGDHWIDIGAHIGCFSKKVEYYHGTVSSYEPCKDNYDLLKKNIKGQSHNVAVGVKDDMVHLQIGSKHYFNKVIGKGSTPQVSFESILTSGCCVKMDIEGAEIPIMDQCDFSKINKMVIAYHTNVDKSRDNLLQRVDRLKQWFDVTHQPIKQEHMNMFPNEVMIYCMKKDLD
jgi:FkbM family methyltransferase